MKAEMDVFGTLDDGREVRSVVLQNDQGMRVELLSYGARIHRIVTPDAQGNGVDVALYCETLEDYVRQKAYLGATLGRYANRIANARFELQGRRIELAPNLDQHQLHGGPEGFDQRVWGVETAVEDDASVVSFSLVSEDGDQGFPGTLNVHVEYRLGNDNALTVNYAAVSDQDSVANISNHVYLNLSGKLYADLSDHEFSFDSTTVTETDEGGISTGAFVSIKDSVLDFSNPCSVAGLLSELPAELMATKGFDHNYVFGSTGECTRRASVRHPQSGVTLAVESTYPGMQFYTANHLRWGDARGPGGYYEDFSAFCLEPQFYPDSPNHPGFPSPLLRAGERQQHTIVYRFGVE